MSRPGILLTLGRKVAPPRFLAFVALLPLGFFGWNWIHPGAAWQDSLAISFDFAALLFLLSLIPLWRDSSPEAMRRHAMDNDANRPLVLILTSMLTLLVFVTITGVLAEARGGNPWAMARLLVTLTLVWLFANAVYTMHYAHAWYASGDGRKGDHQGLDFPGTKQPDYADFAYFAFTLGMTFQTSDISITAPAIRRIALFHSLAAFVFNLGVLAFTINALGGN